MRSKIVEYAEEDADKFFVTDGTDLIVDPVESRARKVAHFKQLSDHRTPTFFFHEHDEKV